LVWSLGLGLAVSQTSAPKGSTPKKATTPQKTAVKKAAPKTTPAKKSTVKKSTAKSTAKKSTAKRKLPAKKRVASWRRGQQQPTPERYIQIQQALIDKQYLQGPATGKWEPDSEAALKKFQADQKLEATGKLDALSLIRLGLGPQKGPASPNGLSPPPENKVEP